MARIEKTGWNPCEEFKRDGEKKSSINVLATRRSDGKFDSINGEGENSISKTRRIKTLAQASRPEVQRVKADLKSMLPKLDPVEVRRFRIPHCDAVILELEEDGLRESADYVSMLLELDEKMRENAGPGSAIWRRPRLKSEKNFLQRLGDALKSAEIAKRTGNLPIQAAALLETAIFFESESPEWFWIAEQLYRSCLKIGAKIRDDQGQIFNVIKYLYGRFLFEKMKDPQEAWDYLNQVRIASEEKAWNVSKILGTKQETLYRESCTLLHQALLSLARQVRNDDPELAVQAATQALERAKDCILSNSSDVQKVAGFTENASNVIPNIKILSYLAVHDEAIASALYELGKSQLSAGDVEIALRSLSKFLAIAKRIPDPEGVCDAHMELAFAYKELEDSEGTVKHLGLFRQCAMEYKLFDKLAQAHYYTGEYLLNKNQANLATPHLELALSQFNGLGKTAEADRARCAAGISKGQEVMNSYIDLILNCQVGNAEAITKICNWKNNRVSFWSATTEDDSEKNIGDSRVENSENFQPSNHSFLSLSSLTSKSSSIIESADSVARIEK